MKTKATKAVDWLFMRQKVEQELSKKQAIICICGRLATGFHESTCRRFQKKVTDETNKRMGKKGE